jgi:hypothetical protein
MNELELVMNELELGSGSLELGSFTPLLVIKWSRIKKRKSHLKRVSAFGTLVLW